MRFANFLRKFGDKKCDINFLVSEFHSIIAKYSMTLLERILQAYLQCSVLLLLGEDVHGHEQSPVDVSLARGLQLLHVGDGAPDVVKKQS